MQDANKNKDSKSFSLKVWKKLFPHLAAHKRLYIYIIVLSVIMAVIDIFFPLFQKYLIEHMIQKQTTNNIWYFAALYGGAVLLQAGQLIVLFKIVLSAEVRVTRDLRDKVFYKYQLLPVSYYNDKSVGYLVAKTISDSERIGSMSWQMMDFLWSFVYLVGLFVPMFLVNSSLALILLMLLPVFFAVGLFFNRRMLTLNRKLRKANSDVAGALNEGITGAKTTKALVAEDVLYSEFKGLTGSYFTQALKYNRFSAAYSTLLGIMGSFAIAAIVSIGGQSFFDGNISISDMSMFLSYASSLIWPVISLVRGITHTIANQANVERILDVIEAEEEQDSPEVVEKYGTIFNPIKENWESMEGDIEFRNVSFKYPGSNTYVLKDFSIKIPKNSSIAFVGETGAGKTTAVNLLCRFYEPTEGEILIDGVDYRKRSRAWLYSHLGYVLQSPHLFSGTVEDNIRFGNRDASIETIKQAASLASCDNIIQKLPKGLESEVGESGGNLSTGEKQLISFARAIAADPRIFILDEATSSIDSDTENLVQKAIGSMLKDRTSIIIAHRLSTIKSADNIVVIENGIILEQGSHNSLIRKKGKYFQLFSRLSELEHAETVFKS